MEETIQQILDTAGDDPGFWHFFLLGCAAMLEYIFPPMPGDVIVLFGAFLVGAKDWSLWAVVVAVNGGSVIGLSIDYAFGCWVGRRDAGWRRRFPRWKRTGVLIDRVKASFGKWGAAYIACNRFLPAVRAAFFVAAGMAKIPYWKVLLWGLVSSLLWNCLIFGVGMSVGYHWERLVGVFRAYSTVAWVVVGVLAVVLTIRWWRVLRREKREEEPGRDDRM